MTVNCPTCNDEFEKEHYMKIHHEHEHNESIAGKLKKCEQCGEKTRVRKWNDRKNSRTFCDKDCHGKWLSENRKGENHPNYNGGYDYPYNGSWNRVRELTIKRDYGKCRMCRLTRRECENNYGRDLHVHHKIPTSYFDDVEEAHVLHNLITLCPDCHDYVEYE